MPYIEDKELRDELDGVVEELVTNPRYDKDGSLNYLLCRLSKALCYDYRTYKQFIGELEMAKLEIYRRVVAGYEDIKKNQNGDVF